MATVSLLKFIIFIYFLIKYFSSGSSSNSALEVSDDFTIVLALPSDIESTYEIEVSPDEAKLVNLQN